MHDFRADVWEGSTYPGLGVLYHDVGNIVFSPGGVVVHGPHDIFEQGDAVFCDALEAID